MDERLEHGEPEGAVPAGNYRFGDFELDPVRETLTGPDGPVALRDHALRVLKLLVERAPEVVSRDEILHQVWGHQALSESSIAQVIRDIRAALGDSARNPSMVATRYGRGYQFVGNVEQVRRDAPSSDSKVDAPNVSIEDARKPERSARARTTWILVGAVLVALLWQWLGDERPDPAGEERDIITLRAVDAGTGDSLSSAFVDYLAFVLGHAVGADRFEVARADDEIEPGQRVVDISLAALESGDRRSLELAIGAEQIDDPALRARLDEANELVGRSVEALMDSLEMQSFSVRAEAGLVSRSSYATETLLRGMSAQFSGDVLRAAELFEAALAEDPDFEFARYELAIALRRSGEHARALAILEPMAQRLDGAFWTHRINNAAGIAHWQLGQYDEALDALRRAEANASSPANRSGVLTNIALLERNRGDLLQAEATAAEAVRLAVEADSPRREAGARNTLASIQIRLDRSEEALDQLERARELFYASGNLSGYASVLSRSARIHVARAERTEAESLIQLALGIRQQLGDEDGIADLEIRLGDLHRTRGDFDSARQLARSGLDRVQAMGADDLIIDAYQSLASLARAENRFDQARSYGNEALRLAELTGRDRDLRAVRYGLLETALAEGRPLENSFEDELNGLITEADDANDGVAGVRARLLLARHLQSTARPDDARRMLERADALRDPADLRLQHELDTVIFDLALERGDLERASAAADRLERANAPAHRSLLSRARLQAERGDFRSAVETAGLARSTIGDWWDAEAQTLLDRWTGATRR